MLSWLALVKSLKTVVMTGMIAMMTLGMIMTALIWKIMIGNQIIEMLSKMIQKLFGVECGKQ